MECPEWGYAMTALDQQCPCCRRPARLRNAAVVDHTGDLPCPARFGAGDSAVSPDAARGVFAVTYFAPFLVRVALARWLWKREALDPKKRTSYAVIALVIGTALSAVLWLAVLFALH